MFRFALPPFVLIFSTLSAQAFTLSYPDPDLKGYQTDKLTFNINTTNCPSNIESLVEEAMDIWNSVPTSRLTLRLGSETTTTAAMLDSWAFPETAVIACSNDFANDSGGDPAMSGVGSTRPITKPGVLQKGYLILNTQNGTVGDINQKSKAKKLIVIAHELGHAIGIGHTDISDALMYYTIGSKTSANLHQDDIDAITYLYPRDELSGDGIMGCGLVKSLPPPPPQNLLLLFLCFILPILTYAGLRTMARPAWHSLKTR